MHILMTFQSCFAISVRSVWLHSRGAVEAGAAADFVSERAKLSVPRTTVGGSVDTAALCYYGVGGFLIFWDTHSEPAALVIAHRSEPILLLGVSGLRNFSATGSKSRTTLYTRVSLIGLRESDREPRISERRSP